MILTIGIPPLTLPVRPSENHFKIDVDVSERRTLALVFAMSSKQGETQADLFCLWI